MLLLAAVGLLIVTLSLFSIYKSRKVSLLNEYENLMEDLQIIADDICSNLVLCIISAVFGYIG